MSKQITTISVSTGVKSELDTLRKELGSRSYDELIRALLVSYRKCMGMLLKEKVLKVLCSEFSETSAALAAWARLLAKKLESKEEISMALELLTPKPGEPGVYIVSKDMCAGERK
jgi:hypothetical protein